MTGEANDVRERRGRREVARVASLSWIHHLSNLAVYI